MSLSKTLHLHLLVLVQPRKTSRDIVDWDVKPPRKQNNSCVSCRILYSIDSCLYVGSSGSIASVGEERANLSAIVYLCGFCFERFPLPPGAWNGLRYFIVALPEPSI